MATRRKGTDPVDYRPSVPEMQAGLRKIARRKTELLALDPNAIQREDDERPFEGWVSMWNDTVAEIFGRDSVQFRDYEIGSLNRPDTLTVVADLYGAGYGAHDARAAFARGKSLSLQTIETIERIFAERLEDAGERPAAKAAAAFRGLPIHEGILRAIGDRYDNGHYEDAVFRSYIALEELVKARPNRPLLSGKALMEQVFSLNTPLLQVADLQDPSGRDEQLGSMHLFSGAALAVRNPRAHTLKADTAERALEQIIFLSHLAKTVDAAVRTRNP